MVGEYAVKTINVAKEYVMGKQSLMALKGVSPTASLLTGHAMAGAFMSEAVKVSSSESQWPEGKRLRCQL